MTPAQLKLARHALGLPNKWRISFRNRFAADRRTPDYLTWRSIVDAGHALRWPWHYSYGDHFCLTRAGAEAALLAGEKLDPEDFPSSSANWPVRQ